MQFNGHQSTLLEQHEFKGRFDRKFPVPEAATMSDVSRPRYITREGRLIFSKKKYSATILRFSLFLPSSDLFGPVSIPRSLILSVFLW